VVIEKARQGSLGGFEMEQILGRESQRQRTIEDFWFPDVGDDHDAAPGLEHQPPDALSGQLPVVSETGKLDRRGHQQLDQRRRNGQRTQGRRGDMRFPLGFA
jgi:hypothetical protein